MGLVLASAELVRPDSFKTLVDLLSEDTVPIVDEEAIGMSARQRFPELLQRPIPPWDGQ